MKYIVYLLFCSVTCFSQQFKFPTHLQKTQIAKLQTNDSLVYYQCRVDEAKQELTTTSGQKITTKSKRITITEKFVIVKVDSIYYCNYSVSPLTNYPNKKFPYLTLTEVKNWEFDFKFKKQLNPQDVLVLAAFETKTHSITHYELNINKTCPNQIIISNAKKSEQRLVEGNYLLCKTLDLL